MSRQLTIIMVWILILTISLVSCTRPQSALSVGDRCGGYAAENCTTFICTNGTCACSPVHGRCQSSIDCCDKANACIEGHCYTANPEPECYAIIPSCLHNEQCRNGTCILDPSGCYTDLDCGSQKCFNGNCRWFNATLGIRCKFLLAFARRGSPEVLRNMLRRNTKRFFEAKTTNSEAGSPITPLCVFQISGSRSCYARGCYGKNSSPIIPDLLGISSWNKFCACVTAQRRTTPRTIGW